MSHFVLCTEDFDISDRVAEFETMAAKMCKLSIEPADSGFASSTSIAVLSDLMIADTLHSPCLIRRNSALAAETGDNILLHIPLSGGFTIRQERGAEAECSPGQIYLDPTEVPGKAWFTPGQSNILYLSVPRIALLAAYPRLDPGLRQVVQASPQWRLLIGYAQMLHAEAVRLEPSQLHLAAMHLQDLLVLALGASREAQLVAQGRGARAARLKAIKADIAANLTLPELRSAWISARHRISDRYVRSLFAQEGCSLPDYIAAQRLLQVHRQLRDPRFQGQSISQIAADNGFGDLSWFNARFRRVFGATPSEVRAGLCR